MDHTGDKFLRRLPRNPKVVAELRQATAMKAKTMLPVPDELICLSSFLQRHPTIAE